MKNLLVFKFASGGGYPVRVDLTCEDIKYKMICMFMQHDIINNNLIGEKIGEIQDPSLPCDVFSVQNCYVDDFVIIRESKYVRTQIHYRLYVSHEFINENSPNLPVTKEIYDSIKNDYGIGMGPLWSLK